jgi:membrane protease YdiL (CAAX protease family)
MHEFELPENDNLGSPFTPPTGDATAITPPEIVPVPGPGLAEACFWTCSCFVVQIVASIAAVIGFAVYVGATQGVGIQEAMRRVQQEFGVGLIAIGQTAFVVYALIAVMLRVGRPWASKLNLSPIAPVHFVLILVLLIPLSQVSGAFYMIGSELWARVVDAIPFLSVMDEANAMEMIGQFADKMSLPVMLLLVAVAPAIAEELIFRGLIGRGLIARWGMVGGIVLTSLFFACVHLHPAHAVGVFPLGIAMHIVYVTTRSFWAPVMLHFANNAMASLAAKLIKTEDLQKAIEGSAEVSMPMILASFATVIAILFVMWKTRVRYIQGDGEIWDPGYRTVERPPLRLETSVSRGPVHWGGLAVVGVCLFGFFAAAAFEGMKHLP